MPDTQPHKPVPRKDAVEGEDQKADDTEADTKPDEPITPEASVAGVSGEFVHVAVDRAREGSHTFKD